MKTKIYIAISIILFIGAWVWFAIAFNKSVTQFKKEYAKPDTTIVCRNGKCDTVITKKSLPFWFK